MNVNECYQILYQLIFAGGHLVLMEISTNSDGPNHIRAKKEDQVPPSTISCEHAISFEHVWRIAVTLQHGITWVWIDVFWQPVCIKIVNVLLKIVYKIIYNDSHCQSNNEPTHNILPTHSIAMLWKSSHFHICPPRAPGSIAFMRAIWKGE